MFVYTITGFYIIIGSIVAMYLLTSCQPKDELRGLNCPCNVTFAEITPRGHIATYIDKDGNKETVISEALYDQYHKNKK